MFSVINDNSCTEFGTKCVQSNVNIDLAVLCYKLNRSQYFIRNSFLFLSIAFEKSFTHSAFIGNEMSPTVTIGIKTNFPASFVGVLRSIIPFRKFWVAMVFYVELRIDPLPHQ